MNEAANWTIALIVLAAHGIGIWWLLGREPVRLGRHNLGVACLLLPIVLGWYFLKAWQIGLTDRWEFAWGVGRRMSDPSHWLLWFIAIMLVTSFFAMRTLDLALSGKSVRLIGSLGVAVVGGMYLLLVRMADAGQTFFYPSGYDTQAKWIQTIEGVTSLTVVAAGVLATLCWIAVFVWTLERAREQRSLPTLGMVPGFFVVVIPLFWGLIESARSTVLAAVDDMPLHAQELEGSPGSNVIVFQIVAVLSVVLLVVAVAWSLTRTTLDTKDA
ncbi:MAG: hypothetical protein NCW75_13955 [Phycisphaera sp.]|nr:MAG: hypothetical protein NCW75_13955 [Phycisphaera sp.]